MRGRPRAELSIRARWALLVGYVVLIYATLPFGPRIGLGILRTGAGGWLLGPGIAVVVGAGAVALAVALRRRNAPAAAYVAIAAAAAGYALAFSALRAQRLERTHLPEYGIAAWLAWRALDPIVPAATWAYVGAAAIAAGIGLGDELLQGVIPGRYYDIRDVAMNAIGGLLGTVVIVALRSGERRAAVSAESSARRSRRAAGS